jgi:phospho-N-acetylmuramoyl-pentapeptide-transferase
MGEALLVTQLTDALVKLTVLAVAAFLFAMALTPLYTYVAYRYRFWKRPRETSVNGEELTVFTKLHKAKHERHIPTMAGVIMIAAIVLITLIANLDRRQTWLPLAALIGGAVVGIIDDIINIRGNGKGVGGLRSGLKFAMISAVALIAAWYFFTKLGYSSLYIPFFGPWEIGWLIVPIFAFAVVATGNAVNISDGLDGLAGGLLAQAYGFFGIIALLQGNYGIAGFCFTVLGALLSYIWFNIYPARFFMGDVGSFALGTALGVVAMLTNTLLLLPIIGLLFVIETGSSLIQMTSKKFFGRKIFLSAPLHHHLEASGWPETKVTMRFWVIGAVCGFLGLLLALAGGSI